MKINGLDQFVRKCEQVRGVLPAGMSLGIRSAAAKTKGTIVASAHAHGWQNTRGWVSYNVFGTGETTFAVVQLRGAHAYWAQRGTKDHTIAGKDKPLRTPYGPRWTVKVKGAKARPFWEEGVAAAVPMVQQEVGKGVASALTKVFGGR